MTERPGDGGVGFSWFAIDVVSEPVPEGPVITVGGNSGPRVFAPIARPPEPFPPAVIRRRRDRDADLLLLMEASR
jgi:hypothetical protein